MAKTRREIEVEALRHRDKRRNIPTAELEPVMEETEKTPIRIAYERRNRDLDPQLVWRGKDEEDWASLVVQAPPLYIQEKIHPKVLVDDLLRQTRARRAETSPPMPDLFADFNGLPDREAATEFYRHDANWSNRMILGDSLSVMASLAEREGLRGRVQCIYLDPPYGIRFNSNFQWSTTSRDVKDGNKDHITREPEQVRAFRDTWRHGIHSYLTYLRDRLTVARDLLADSGSIFVQIGDENVHRVRAVMDEVFGEDNFVSEITVTKTGSLTGNLISSVTDNVLWYSRDLKKVKFRKIFDDRTNKESGEFSADPLKSSGSRIGTTFDYDVYGREFACVANEHWKIIRIGLDRLYRADRLVPLNKSLRMKKYFEDFPVQEISNIWTGMGGSPDMVYVVQTTPRMIERCVLMTTDPGDLVLDPTCGSGTTAYVAEQWGRRWITIDTSRVALALARARIMGARYPYYLLADSPEGQKKEGEAARTPPKETPTHGDIRHGFVYERVPHITLKSIANNAEIDVIWERWQETLEPLRERLNGALGRPAPHPSPLPASGERETDGALQTPRPASGEREGPAPTAREGEGQPATGRPWEEWEVPRAATADWPEDAKKLHARWWAARIARQQEIDASIAAKAELEYLYDKPYPDNSRIRVAGPFTVESLSPHRVLAVDQDDSLIDTLALAEDGAEWGATTPDFAQMVLENLKTAGVQQAHKEDRIAFTSLVPWPGKFICAEGRYIEGGDPEKSSSPAAAGEGDRAQHGGGGALASAWPNARTPSASLRSPPPPPGGGGAGSSAGRTAGTAAGAAREKRAAIFLGPEFGTVSRPDLVAAAREAADARFDVVIACAFNFDAHSSEFERLGRIPILKARMNADLHMAGELKSTGSGNLFVIFGEPDIEVVSGQWLVTSSGRKVMSHERFAQLSGLGGLEEVDRLGRGDLSRIERLAVGRKVWPDQPSTAGGSLDPGQHRGGGGAARHAGVPPVPERGQGLARGGGDVRGPGGEARLSDAGRGEGLVRTGGGDRPDAFRPHEVAEIEALTPADFPLSLTTDHWTQVTLRGVDVFHPQRGEVVSGGPESIALWFIDTDYNEESFFVRHAYFLGAETDPYKALKTTLKAEIDEEAWTSLRSDTSRPFPKPKSGRIAVKVVNHLGDEVMKVFSVR